MTECKSQCSTPDFLMEYDVRISNRDSYIMGYYRCRSCNIYIKCDSNRCPCCNTLMAVKARNNIHRQKIEVFRY